MEQVPTNVSPRGRYTPPKIALAFTWHILLCGSIALAGVFFGWVETRPGVQLADPVLALIPPSDFTWLIFSLTYPSIAFLLVRLMRDPDKLIQGLQAYVAILALRVLTNYLTPLDPPAGLIPLIDPLVENLSTGTLVTRDLMFSGHTSTMFMLAFMADRRDLKVFFTLIACTVGTLLMIQHVHYTIDIVSAPVFAYAACRVVRLTYGVPTRIVTRLFQRPHRTTE